jgi:hypothetical protein
VVILQIVSGAHEESDTQATTISLPPVTIPAIGGITSGVEGSDSEQAKPKETERAISRIDALSR